MRTHTCVELGQALADETADHIIMAHVEGGWNCSAAELPPHTANLRRPLVLEGEGPGLLYYDVRMGCAAPAAVGLVWLVAGCGMRRWHPGPHLTSVLPQDRSLAGLKQ